MLQGTDRPLRALGIETSCDETAAAVVEMDANGGRIVSNVVLSQVAEHAAFGGVVPELAARAHVTATDGVVAAALEEAGLTLADMDMIAATAGPGLIGGLIVGLMTGKALAKVSGKPLAAVNHLEAHALTARLTDGIDFPYLLLLVSGGHTQIVLVRGVGRYERWGTTIDDALGEAFDKTAKLLGLPYPGGPNVERAALQGDAGRFDFPRPLKGTDRLDFSFSGLKTAVRQAATAIGPLGESDVADICAAFQAAIVDTLADRVGRALATFHALSGRRRAGPRGGRRRRGKPCHPRDPARPVRQKRLPLHRAADGALHRQRRDGRMGRAGAPARRPAGRRGRIRLRAALALAA